MTNQEKKKRKAKQPSDNIEATEVQSYREISRYLAGRNDFVLENDLAGATKYFLDQVALFYKGNPIRPTDELIAAQELVPITSDWEREQFDVNAAGRWATSPIWSFKKLLFCADLLLAADIIDPKLFGHAALACEVEEIRGLLEEREAISERDKLLLDAAVRAALRYTEMAFLRQLPTLSARFRQLDALAEKKNQVSARERVLVQTLDDELKATMPKKTPRYREIAERLERLERLELSLGRVRYILEGPRRKKM